MRAMSLAYHDVVDGHPILPTDIRPGASLYTLTRECFQNHLRSIQEQDAPVELIRSFRRWQNQVPAFLTFDDGALNAFCAADELERRGWRGHFFITTNWIGRSGFLNRRQIRDLNARGHVIGSHSCSHPERMSHLTWNNLSKEWSESRAALSDILGEPVQVASVPNGFYSRKVAQAAAAAGLRVLFTSEATGTSSVIDGCLVLGRYLIQWRTPAETAGAIAAGRLWPQWKQTVLWQTKKVLKRVMGESYLALRRISLSKLKPQASGCSLIARKQHTHET
jgi:peptidoglycan/xylan/chitin deacetylase (PgdA/CDA1 family)